MKKLSTVFRKAAKFVEEHPEQNAWYFAMGVAAFRTLVPQQLLEAFAEEYLPTGSDMPMEPDDVRVLAFGFLAAIAESEGK